MLSLSFFICLSFSLSPPLSFFLSLSLSFSLYLSLFISLSFSLSLPLSLSLSLSLSFSLYLSLFISLFLSLLLFVYLSLYLSLFLYLSLLSLCPFCFLFLIPPSPSLSVNWEYPVLSSVLARAVIATTGVLRLFQGAGLRGGLWSRSVLQQKRGMCWGKKKQPYKRNES